MNPTYCVALIAAAGAIIAAIISKRETPSVVIAAMAASMEEFRQDNENLRERAKQAEIERDTLRRINGYLLRLARLRVYMSESENPGDVENISHCLEGLGVITSTEIQIAIRPPKDVKDGRERKTIDSE